MRCLLITGLGRSGSTITHQVLNAHPSVFLSDESSHFLHAAFNYSSRNERSLMGMQDEDYARHLADHLVALYRGLTPDGGYFGDKSPPAFTRLEEIQMLLGLADVPLQLVWTVRHPFDQALSWIERFESNSLPQLRPYRVRMQEGNYGLREVFGKIFEVWIAQQQAMEQHPGPVVVYEQLVGSPTQILGDLHQQLGLEFSEDQIESALQSRVIGGDPKFMETTSIHSDSKLRFQAATEQFQAALRAAAETTGLQSWTERYDYEL